MDEPAMMRVSQAPVPLDQDRFLRGLVRALTGTLEEVVGLREAAGYISVVGQEIGADLDRAYREALGVPALDRDHVAAVLVDLKRRIGGDFFVIERTEDRIVLGNRACPFGDRVKGRPSMCMMTSNVFGVIAAENLGYGKVDLQETIASGHPSCRVVVHLRTTAEAEASPGREYFRS